MSSSSFLLPEFLAPESRLSAASRSVTCMGFSTPCLLCIGYTDSWEVLQTGGNPQLVRVASSPTDAPVTALHAFLFGKGESQKLFTCVVVKTSATAVRIGAETVLRSTKPVLHISSTDKYLVLACEGCVQLFAIERERQPELGFSEVLTVQTGVGSRLQSAALALHTRWLAFNLPPQQSLALGTVGSLWDHTQRAFDNLMLRIGQSVDEPPSLGSATQGCRQRCGIVAVRDVSNGQAVALFEAHTEPVDWLRFGAAGLLLVSASGLGHKILVHRAASGSAGVAFQPLFVLSRGVTPALISDIQVARNGDVAVASGKGTVHLFRLPEAGAAPQTLTATARLKLGSVLAPELLLPVLLFPTQQAQLLVASRTGGVAAHDVDAALAAVWTADACVFKSPHIPDSSVCLAAASAPATGGLSARHAKSPDVAVYRSPVVAIFRTRFKAEPCTGKYTKVDAATSTRLQTLLSPSSAGVKVAIQDAKHLELAMKTSVDTRRRSPTLGDGRRRPSDDISGFVAL